MLTTELIHKITKEVRAAEDSMKVFVKQNNNYHALIPESIRTMEMNTNFKSGKTEKENILVIDITQENDNIKRI